MPPKKRKNEAAQGDSRSTSKKQKTAVSWGVAEVDANGKKGLLTLPAELHDDILKNFGAPNLFTQPAGDIPILSGTYLQRSNVLRALSATSVAYRRIFLPMLWESLMLCCQRGEPSRSFYKDVGETMYRKTAGLIKNPQLAQYVGIATVVLTRYQSATLLPEFSACLKSLPNLHTLHVVHAHTQMTTAIRVGFEGVVLNNIRTLVIPGHCHEILRCCPRVTKVWCTEGDGSKLVTVIGKHCKEVEEIVGFLTQDVAILKRIIKAAPNLQILELDNCSEDCLALLPSLKKLHTIILREFRGINPAESLDLRTKIIPVKSAFLRCPTIPQKRRILVRHPSSYQGNSACVEYCFTAIDMDLIET